jgi:UDP-N-acetylglucosamine 2-epimerase (non-hydrolysing)
MPEEINRIVTDSISDLLFTTEKSGTENLRHEGVKEEKIHFVGNTMIDSLVYCRGLFDRTLAKGPVAMLDGNPYFLATIHRPSNVDDPDNLSRVVDILKSASDMAPLFFVAHPRTRERLKTTRLRNGLIELDSDIGRVQRGFIYLLPPLAYLDFLRLMASSKAVLTDSGGIQEETTYLGIPCLTMRSNTERPITVGIGTNVLVGLKGESILCCLKDVMAGTWKSCSIPPLWDGHAASRVVEVIKSHFVFALASADKEDASEVQ